MSPQTVASAILIILFLPCFTGKLSSQSIQDYRLSPDALDYRLPEEIRIQAAGRIGDSRLVVWGTTVDDGRGNVVNALVINVNGTQKRLTSPEGRPYGAVGVVPLADRFLVVWNDRRSGEEGIRARTVLKDGEFGGSEFVFSPDGVIRGEVYWWSGAEGAYLFWSDARSGVTETRGRMVDREGQRLANELLFGEGAFDPQATFLSENGFLILGRGAFEGLVLRPDGRIETRRIPPGRLSNPWYTENDTSVVLYEEGHLRYYRSVFDPEPLWSVPVSMIPSGEHAPVIGRDSAGLFLASHVGQRTIDGYCLMLRKTYVNPADSTTHAMSIDIDCIYIPPIATSSEGNVDILILERRGDNAYRAEVLCNVFYDLHGSSLPRRDTHHVVYALTAQGRVVVDSRAASFLPPMFGDVEALRTGYDTTSNMRVIRYGQDTAEPTDVSEAISPTVDQLDDVRPGMGIRDNRICLFWTQEGLAQSVIRYEAFPEQPLYGAPRLFTDEDIRLMPGANWEQVWNGGVRFSVVGESELKEYPAHQLYWTFSSTCYIHIPTGNGWDRIMLDERVGVYTDFPGFIKPVATSFDPNTGATTSVALIPRDFEPPNRSMLSFLRFYPDRVDDTSRWRVAGLDNIAVDYVPIRDTLGIVVVKGDRAVILSPNSSPRSFTFTPALSGSAHRYQRLFGDRFARFVSSDFASGLPLLEVYSLDGALLHSRSMEEAVGRRDVFILQNSSDSAILLLWGGDAGIRGTYLDQNLRVMADASDGMPLRNVQLSATAGSVSQPSGIVRDDTLFIAWEDFRNGQGPDIYGTKWKVPQDLRISDVPVSPDRMNSGLQIISITPNPVIGQGGVTIESTERKGGRIALYDALGRRVLDEEVILSEGVHTYRLDVSGFSGGSYGVRVSSGEGVASSRVIVYPQ